MGGIVKYRFVLAGFVPGKSKTPAIGLGETNLKIITFKEFIELTYVMTPSKYMIVDLEEQEVIASDTSAYSLEDIINMMDSDKVFVAYWEDKNGAEKL